MRKIGATVAAITLLALGIALAQTSRPAGTTSVAPTDDRIKQGRYIVHHVAMCIECHTPRDDRGDLIMGRLLQGARMPVRSPFAQQEWCFETPQIAGLPGWSDEEAVRFFMNGRDYRGYQARAPMPQFRMTR